jgi:hypothetical protein
MLLLVIDLGQRACIVCEDSQGEDIGKVTIE